MHGSPLRRALVFLASAIAFAVVVPAAAADSVYHTEKLPLASVGGTPLRSGFVLNIKANGPTIYAHEIYVLDGAAPGETYTVTNNFYDTVTGDVHDADRCVGDFFPIDTATLTTGPRGNATGRRVLRPGRCRGTRGGPRGHLDAAGRQRGPRVPDDLHRGHARLATDLRVGTRRVQSCMTMQFRCIVMRP